MLGEECLGEIQQVVDYLVIAVCPERSELERIACVFGFVTSTCFKFFYVIGTSGI